MRKQLLQLDATLAETSVMGQVIKPSELHPNLTSIDNRICILETLCAECGALLTKVTIKHQSMTTSPQNDVRLKVPSSVRQHQRNTLLSF